MNKALTYADAGVDIEKANSLIPSIKEIAKKTNRKGVIGNIGGFGGLFSLKNENYERPVLVSSTDGVGTKLKIAFMTGKHDTIGIDLVAMSVNDIIVSGAEPLFFLDYFATGKIDEKIILQVIEGVAEGCKQAKCSLLGGETAELPDFYKKNEYDLAGFALGVVDNNKIIDGTNIGVGNKLIGIPSSGLHSNGYSLVRKICFEVLKLKTDSYVEDLKETIGDCLLTPTKIYSNAIQTLIKNVPVHGIAHITGGGLPDNVSRILPKSCKAVIQKGWKMPNIFPFLQSAGNIEDSEMMRTFNNGIGMVVVVPESSVENAKEMLGAVNEESFVIGEIQERKEGEEQVIFVN